MNVRGVHIRLSSGVSDESGVFVEVVLEEFSDDEEVLFKVKVIYHLQHMVPLRFTTYRTGTPSGPKVCGVSKEAYVS